MTALEKILQLKNQNNVSDAKLERDIGLKPKTIYDWKRGKSTTYYDNIISIANYFNVSTDYLLGNEQKEKPASQLSDTDLQLIDLFSKLNDEDKAMYIKLLRNQIK